MNNRITELSAAALKGATDAVELIFSIGGIMCLWSGFMRVAEKAGIIKKISKIISPVLRLLFPNLSDKSKAKEYISMNIAANFFGLGNAATPIGLKAMEELQKVNKTTNIASDEMITFVVINSASIQLIPSTIAAIRMAKGSTQPFDIMPAVWLTSISALLIGLITAKICRLFIK